MTRLLWPVLLATLAIVALFAQLDRQARYSPELSQWVPEPFSSFSRVHHIEQSSGGPDSELVTQNALEQSLSQARALIARRPIPAEHHRLLAEAQLAIGQLKRATVTIEQAARHGWRNQRIQQAMLVLAMKAQDDQQAAMRLASLWALSRDRKALQRYSNSTLESPIARREFAKILAGARWRRNFLISGSSFLTPDVFAETLEVAFKAGAQFDCKRLNRSLNAQARSADMRHNALMTQSGC
ncbi:MAG: hypothetical protein ABJ239_00615 [Erythrobacter sp.]